MRDPKDFASLIPMPVLTAIRLLEDAGHEAYIVGGAVRDFLIGNIPDDFDVTTSAKVEETEKVFRDYKTIPTGIAHGTITVLIDGAQIEITTFRLDGDYIDHRHPGTVEFTPDLSEDLKRRDFTVNAMAYSPSRGLVDENGGVSDIENRIIRCVGDPSVRFSEDALRIMRALRFAAKLGFDIDQETLSAAVKMKGDLAYVSRERINVELSKLLTTDHTGKLKELLTGEAGSILFELIPKLRDCLETPQINSFHSYDVYTHTVLAVCAIRNDLLLRMTMLLHDIAKPESLWYDDKGNTHFTNHALKGADVAEDILNGFRYPKKFTARAKTLIKYHEFFRDPYIKQGAYDKAAGKLIRLAGIELAQLLPDVIEADAMAKNPEYSVQMTLLTDKLRASINRIIDEGLAVTGPSSLNVSGKQLEKAGIAKGEVMGKIIARLTEKVSEFDIPNENGALINEAKRIFREEFSVENKEKLVADRFKAWTTGKYFDRDTREELLAVKDSDDIYDRFYRDLEFGTAGLRGVMGAGTNRMNIYIVRRVSFAIADYIKSFGPQAAERGIAVSYDTRLNSELFAKEAAAAFASCGIKTRIFRAPAPVPVLSYTVWSGNFQAGIMITASHNPKQYNGYKVYWEGGVQISPAMAAEITKIIDQYDDFSKIPDPSFGREIRRPYLEYFGDDVSQRFVERVAALKVDRDILENHSEELCVVYTPLFGAGAGYVGRAVKHLGFKNFHTVRSQMRPDGNFPGLTVPNPENPAALEKGIRLAKKLKADLVFGTDPDSDRMGAAVRLKDGTYKSLTGNEIGCLFMDYIIGVRKRNNCLPKDAFAVSTIVSTDLAGEIAKKSGVEFKSVLTGFKFIGDLITEENKNSFILGFEESYGFLTEGYARDKDGVAASVVLCEMALYNKVVLKRSLVDALDDIHKRFGYRSESAFSIELPGESGHENILKLMAGLRNAGPGLLEGRINAIDDVSASTRKTFDKNGKQTGVSELTLPKSDVLKYYLDDGWFAVRPSGTEPKVKIYVGIKDFDSEKNCVEKAAKLKELLYNKAKKIIDQ